MRYPITAQRIKEALNENFMSAQELANKTGIAKSSISGYVNGTHTIGNVKAMQIGQVLGVSPLWLMEFDSPKFDMREIESELDGLRKTVEKETESEAMKLYTKYLLATPKTRKMIDMLLEEGE